MLNNWRKKRAIKAYISMLPLELKKRYGGSGRKDYSEAQVKKTTEDLGLDIKYIEFAILLFCGKQALEDAGFEQASILGLNKFLQKAGYGDVSSAGIPGTAGAPIHIADLDAGDGGDT